MPVRGTSSKTNFIDILDEVYEILKNFDLPHAVFLVGDLNSSLKIRSGNDRNAILFNFISENQLHQFQNGTSTYIYSDGINVSEIDYILCNDTGNRLVKNVKVERDCALNISDHLPVIAELNIFTLCDTSTEKKTIVLKPKWDKCDKKVYQMCIRNSLKYFPEEIQ